MVLNLLAQSLGILKPVTSRDGQKQGQPLIFSPLMGIIRQLAIEGSLQTIRDNTGLEGMKSDQGHLIQQAKYRATVLKERLFPNLLKFAHTLWISDLG